MYNDKYKELQQRFGGELKPGLNPVNLTWTHNNNYFAVNGQCYKLNMSVDQYIHKLEGGNGKKKSKIKSNPSPVQQSQYQLPELSGTIPMPDGWRFRPSDLSNSEIFSVLAVGKLLYIPELKLWHDYNGERWIADIQRVEVEKICTQVIQAIYGLSATAGTENERKMYAAWALKSEDEARRKAMVSGAERIESLVKSLSDFDKNPWIFPVQNGVINLKTGNLRPHNPQDYILKISPVTYDPKADCPLWKSTLNLFFQNQKSIIDYVQKLFGYTLCGVKNERLIVFLYGEGRNGKSTITGIPLYVFGDYGRAADISTFIESKWGRQPGSASEDVARLAGVRYVKTTEIGQHDKLNEKFVKDLSGGDTITARNPYGRSFDFKAALTLWMYGNEKIQVDGQDTGIKDRIKFIPLNFQVPKESEDKKMSARIIENESAGVLNWILEGCKRWQGEGLAEPEEIIKSTNDFFSEQDPVGQFVKECCTISDTGNVKYKTLYAGFCKYSDVNLSKKKFSKALSRLGYDVIPLTDHVRYVIGLDFTLPKDDENTTEDTNNEFDM